MTIMETSMYEQTTTTNPAAMADDAVVEITNAVCESLLGAIPVECDPAGVHGDRISSFVSISGAWRGDVEIRLSISLATRLCREVLQVEASSTDDPNVRDVIGEVANIIGGNLKALLPEPCVLSLPKITLRTRLEHPDFVRAFVLGDDAFEVAIGSQSNVEGGPS